MSLLFRQKNAVKYAEKEKLNFFAICQKEELKCYISKILMEQLIIKIASKAICVPVIKEYVINAQ